MMKEKTKILMKEKTKILMMLNRIAPSSALSISKIQIHQKQEVRMKFWIAKNHLTPFRTEKPGKIFRW